MSDALQRLKEQAQPLDLVGDLLANLEDVDGAFAAEWTAESEDRLAVFHSGTLGAVRIFKNCRRA